jgi:hypothetical protein
VTVIGLMSELIALVRLIRTLSVGDLQDRLPQAAMSRRVSHAERRRVAWRLRESCRSDYSSRPEFV